MMWPAHAILLWLALNILMGCTQPDVVVDKERCGSIGRGKNVGNGNDNNTYNCTPRRNLTCCSIEWSMCDVRATLLLRLGRS